MRQMRSAPIDAFCPSSFEALTIRLSPGESVNAPFGRALILEEVNRAANALIVDSARWRA